MADKDFLAEFTIKVEYNREMIPVDVKLTRHGQFATTLRNNDDRFFGTLDALKEAVVRDLRRGKVEYNIPVVLAHDGVYARGILRGINHRTNEALLTINGKKESQKYFQAFCLGDEISDEEMTSLNTLLVESRRADAAAEAAANAIKRRAQAARKARGETGLYASDLIKYAEAKAEVVERATA